jgi:hypothetical protein
VGHSSVGAQSQVEMVGGTGRRVGHLAVRSAEIQALKVNDRFCPDCGSSTKRRWMLTVRLMAWRLTYSSSSLGVEEDDDATGM